MIYKYKLTDKFIHIQRFPFPLSPFNFDLLSFGLFPRMQRVFTNSTTPLCSLILCFSMRQANLHALSCPTVNYSLLLCSTIHFDPNFSWLLEPSKVACQRRVFPSFEAGLSFGFKFFVLTVCYCSILLFVYFGLRLSLACVAAEVKQGSLSRDLFICLFRQNCFYFVCLFVLNYVFVVSPF